MSRSHLKSEKIYSQNKRQPQVRRLSRIPSRSSVPSNSPAIQTTLEYTKRSRAFNRESINNKIIPKRTSTILPSKSDYLKSYLNLLVQEGLVLKETVDCAWQVWQDLDNHFLKDLPVPSASPGPEGQILYTWDRDEHHLEIEFSLNQLATLFYINRVTGFAEELDFTNESLSLFHDFLVKSYYRYPTDTNCLFGYYQLPPNLPRQELRVA